MELMQKPPCLRPVAKGNGFFDFAGLEDYFTGLKMITITEKAAEEIKSLLASKGLGAESGLRVGISRGGCAGLQYDMSLGGKAPDDTVCERDGVQIFVDAESQRLLSGSILDYVDDLAGSGFRVVNPNAVRSCGCGTSFEPETAVVTQ